MAHQAAGLRRQGMRAGRRRQREVPKGVGFDLAGVIKLQTTKGYGLPAALL
ncbi:hypothetical protein HNQ92_003030 [Rhabdobacter roseus]|uniref:Uncharacterized protein n=1 Tax=Rhabdobacter roseus TaxID=1655419 RepID=A0A840TTL1_9BACT|nr:hypothetical protein [Rhabdobacter roseus]MBB5284882.1 hypothetical protein [Rhabdobacter roseus]